MSMTLPVLIKKKTKMDKKGCYNWKKQLRQQKEVVALISSHKYVDYLCSSRDCTARFMLPLLPISKALLWNLAALSFKTSNTQLADFIRNMLYCPNPPKHDKTDFLLVAPAIFSVKAIVPGQWTERALFSDSILL